MTDKVQKIHEEIKMVVNRRLNLLNGDYFNLIKETDGFTNEIIDIINSMQKESVSEKKCILTKDSYTDEDRKVLCEDCKEKCEYSKKKEFVSEDLEEAASRYAKEEYSRKNPATLPDRCRGCYAPLMYAFKAGAQWQEEKDKSVTKDLGDYINKLSKQFPEVSFAKLSRIAVRVAKWKEQQLMANAVEGVVHHFEKCKVASVHYNDPTGVPMAYFTSPEGLSAGDKVKINVIKED